MKDPQGVVRRLVLTVLSAAALAALPGEAEAATLLHTLPTTEVTTRSAVLHGTIQTGGLATTWQFQYGPTRAYGQSTPAQLIPLGVGATYVVAQINLLRPNTTYHYRVAGVLGTVANYVERQYGADLVFRTRPTGRLLLSSHQLSATGGSVTVPLTCRSRIACSGSLSIVERPSGPRALGRPGARCAIARYTIPAGKTLELRTGVRQACLSSLRAAPQHRLTSALDATTGTGQLGLSTVVDLILS